MDNFAGAGLFVLALIGLVVCAASIAVAVIYILMLRNALSRCAPENRTTTPDSAWYLLIPFFNLVWQFILYPHITNSLEKEFRQRNLPFDASAVKNLGLALAILNVCCLIPGLNALAGIPALICLVLYWIKISSYSAQIASPAPASQALYQTTGM